MDVEKDRHKVQGHGIQYDTRPKFKAPSPPMQLLFDLVPLVAFFVAYKFGGIYIATGVLIVAVVIQAIVQWLKHRKVSPMMLTSAVLVLIFGGLTLVLKDANFIKWKPTILYWLFSIAFLASRFVSEKPLIEYVFSEGISVERAIWNRANTWYALFFASLGAANLFVAFRYSEETWVYFKFVLFGVLAVFTFAVAFWLFSKMPPEQLAEMSNPKAPAPSKSDPP
jgi:intracellular septation protein